MPTGDQDASALGYKLLRSRKKCSPKNEHATQDNPGNRSDEFHGRRRFHATCNRISLNCAVAEASAFSGPIALTATPSTRTTSILVMPMKPRIARRYGSWKSNGLAGPSE